MRAMSPSDSHSGSSPAFVGQLPLKRNVLYAIADGGNTLVPCKRLTTDVLEIQGQSLSPETIGELKPEFDRTPFSDWRFGEHVPAGLCLAVPTELISLFQERSRCEPFQQTELRQLRSVNHCLQPTPVYIGYFNNRPIHFEHLSGRMPMQDGEFFRNSVRQILMTNDSTLTEDAIRAHTEALLENDRRLQGLNDYRRAYCGWLMTNPQFVHEQAALYREFRTEVEQADFPSAFGLNHMRRDDKGTFHIRCEEHYERWVLQGIAGIDLPNPLEFQYVQDHHPSEQDDRLLSSRMVYPVHLPVHGRGFLAETFAANRPKWKFPHLEEWFEITEKDDAGMNKMAGYIRRLKITIYLRGLDLACGDRKLLKKSVKVQALAEYLGVSQDTIKNDLKAVENVLSLYSDARSRTAAD
jgi:hypothetical protein